MAKMYRALGVTAIVMLLGLIGQAILLSVEANGRAGFQVAPGLAAGPTGGVYFWLLTVIWPLTVSAFAPIIATFAVVIAWQTRQWAWLAIMLVAGLVGVWGSALLATFPLLPALGVPSPSNYVMINLAIEVIPPALTALAALVFAALGLRAEPPAQRGAAQPG